MTAPPELILHIGHFKTGTTALQNFMELNHAQLAAQGLTYATTGREFGKHSELANALWRGDAPAQPPHDGAAAPIPAADLWAQLFDEVRSRDGATLVSSEDLMRLAVFDTKIETLRAILGTAPDIRCRVIAYLRPPQQHLHSWFNQLIKVGFPVGNFDTAVRLQMEAIHWDYALALNPWIELFGADRVIVRQFDDGLRKNNGLFEDFLGALGFELPQGAETPPYDPNPRLDDRLLGLRRALQRAGLPAHLVNRLMIQAAETLTAENRAQTARRAHSFKAIRRRAQAGILDLAALPHAAIDADQMLAALPTRMPDDAKALDDMVAVLAGELATILGDQSAQNARLDALETQLAALLGQAHPQASDGVPLRARPLPPEELDPKSKTAKSPKRRATRDPTDTPR